MLCMTKISGRWKIWYVVMIMCYFQLIKDTESEKIWPIPQSYRSDSPCLREESRHRWRCTRCLQLARTLADFSWEVEHVYLDTPNSERRYETVSLHFSIKVVIALLKPLKSAALFQNEKSWLSFLIWTFFITVSTKLANMLSIHK